MRPHQAAVISALTLSTPVLAGGVERYRVAIVWERAGTYPTPFVLTAEPLPYFDTWNGERRLARLRTGEARWEWESRVTINNTLAECTCIYYSTYRVEAWALTPILELQFGVVPDHQGHRLGAPPFTQTFATHTWSAGHAGYGEATMRTWEGFLELNGTGLIPITLHTGLTGSEYDTYGIGRDPNGPTCDCSGPLTGGAHWGFDEYYSRFEFECMLEYHWVDSCGADLTTWSDPNQVPRNHYGVPDGFLDSHDFFYYIEQYGAGNLEVADMTTTAIPGSPGYGVANGVLNGDDFFYYLSLYAAGC
jgi:hypothetical protein